MGAVLGVEKEQRDAGGADRNQRNHEGCGNHASAHGLESVEEGGKADRG